MSDDGASNGREAAIFRAWLRLEDHETSHPEHPYAKVLHLRRTRPETPIAVLAEVFSGLVGSPISPEKFRKILHQARVKFLEFFNESGHGRS